MNTRIKGKFTFQTAGVLFVVSALFELVAIRSQVPLFGNIRGGLIAAAYHLIYVALFSLLGIGLFKARPWACKLVFAATGLYTLDRMLYLLDAKALKTYLTALLSKYGVGVGGPEMDIIYKAAMMAAGLTVACWWGFAWYTYLRRQYFKQGDMRGISK